MFWSPQITQNLFYINREEIKYAITIEKKLTLLGGHCKKKWAYTFLHR